MYQDPAVLLLSITWGLFAAALAWYCATLATKLTFVTLADGRKQTRSIPLIIKIVLPLAPNMAPLIQHRMFEKERERATRSLISSGFEGLLSCEEYIASRMLLPVLLGLPWIFFIYGMNQLGRGMLSSAQLPLSLVGIICLYFYPVLWLKGAIAARHRSIQRSLPFVLDLLTLSVEAGMDFMSALQRHVERAKVDPLGEELIRVIRENQIGKTRRDALRDMSNRVDLTELRSVVAALVQADELGVSIGTMLRIQSDQIRQRRFERAEKLANEAPVKMLGPLLLCIFPSVLLILLGPILHKVMNQVF